MVAAAGAAAAVAAAEELASAGEAPTDGASREPPILVRDALAGLVRLVARSPTLDGSIPLRAAQACTPLLEGNAVGRELSLTTRVELRRGLRGASIARFDEREAHERRARAALPMLVAAGALSAGEGARFERGPLVVKGSRASLFTGLFVEAPAGVVLRVSPSANRRARSYRVRERVVRPSEGLVPLVLELELERGEGPVVLEGELATIVPLVERWTGEVVPLERDLEAALAHVRFYDRAYFESKKRGATRKYRSLVRRAGPSPPREAVRVIEAGPRSLELAGDRLLLRAALDLRASFDGSTVSVELDRDALGELARGVRDAWAPVLRGPLASTEVFEGALLYLTKYVTPHPKGEPHFFVKPPALLATPPGWSTLIDGMKSPGLDVLRGVVRTDVFHAVPAVFALAAPFEAHRVARGAVLAELFPSPRSVLERPFELAPLSLGGLDVG